MPYDLASHTPSRQPATLAEQVGDPKTPLDGVTLYTKALAGRRLPAFRARGGMGGFLQPCFATQKIAYWGAPGNSTTTPVAFGAASLTSTGTATARNVATTNMFTRCRRVGYVSAATAGSATGARLTTAQWTVGGGAGLGGFFFAAIFGISDASILAAGRTFAGLISDTAAPTDVEPSTLTNCIGVGSNSADTTMQIYYGGSSAQTRIDLGANFPSDTTNADLYRACFYSSPWEVGQVYYEVTRLNIIDSQTGLPVYVASGRLFGVPSTQIPAATTFLCPKIYRSNGGNATAVGIDVSSIYIETEQ